MTRSIVLSSRLITPLLISALFVSSPVWSDTGIRPSVDKPAGNAVTDKGKDKNVLDQDGENSVKKERSVKDGGSVKKSAVKKAGTAAAAGIATKKVTSTIKK
ncbi:MAG TPA: hypothetical protein DDW55_14045 [Gammaproteobacteria bacterium]|nr:hypothetical protein [Gammaproteobacteria bacterium]